ncbi:hypothetical protein RclHR1_09030007 [Rhizophagus clarus]|uniref:Uncharacterized protein n=1 Tax=Rhizophagus clarus TaxID=94130 RepID=A0A2Z6SDJ8_9GLOM|nr:hypothetical protein RclHR1_09030007 [Rhizophagus clarus]
MLIRGQFSCHKYYVRIVDCSQFSSPLQKLLIINIDGVTNNILKLICCSSFSWPMKLDWMCQYGVRNHSISG